MNDFENKLRSRKFLPPPARVRQQVLAAGETVEEAPAPKTWRDWFWPSPLAWGAVAALLVGALIFNAQMPAPRVPAGTARALRDEPSPPTSYAFFQERQDLEWLLETR